MRNPGLVHDFYNARRRQLRDVEPNAAHWALAEFEKAHDGDFLLITQNVDDLHKRAGSRQLASMHGDLLSMRCLACDTVAKIQEDLSAAAVCQSCNQSGVLRPDIVWFGEMPYCPQSTTLCLVADYLLPSALPVMFIRRPVCANGKSRRRPLY